MISPLRVIFSRCPYIKNICPQPISLCRMVTCTDPQPHIGDRPGGSLKPTSEAAGSGAGCVACRWGFGATSSRLPAVTSFTSAAVQQLADWRIWNPPEAWRFPYHASPWCISRGFASQLRSKGNSWQLLPRMLFPLLLQVLPLTRTTVEISAKRNYVWSYLKWAFSKSWKSPKSHGWLKQTQTKITKDEIKPWAVFW